MQWTYALKRTGYYVGLAVGAILAVVMALTLVVGPAKYASTIEIAGVKDCQPMVYVAPAPPEKIGKSAGCNEEYFQDDKSDKLVYAVIAGQVILYGIVGLFVYHLVTGTQKRRKDDAEIERVSDATAKRDAWYRRLSPDERQDADRGYLQYPNRYR